MPRISRLAVAGYPYHVIIRGNNRGDTFYSDSDRLYFLKCLKEAKEKIDAKVFAYCLMTNHIHMILEPSLEHGVSLIVQSLGRKYVRYVNSKYKRTGTLWEGRFKSSLINKETHLLACLRYVELNPVRAGLVKRPEDYRWSSFNERMGAAMAERLLDFDDIFLSLAETEEDRRANYRNFVCEGGDDMQLQNIRTLTQKGGVLGTEAFVDKLTQFVGRDLKLRPNGRPKIQKN